MTSTSFEEFKKLFFKIPKEQLEYVHFIALRAGTKVPFSAWKEKENWLNFYEIKNKMKTGWNIAAVAVPKGIMFLDIDVNESGKLPIPDSVLQEIPETFTVKTRSGGLHYYFLNLGAYDTQMFHYDGKDVGELRANWSYVVCPGSWIEPATYKVFSDMPIAPFAGEIVKYFRKDEEVLLFPWDKKEKKEKIPILYGKKGKRVTEEHQILMEATKAAAEKGNEENEVRRKQIINMLKR